MISIFIIICFIVVPNREKYTNLAMRQKYVYFLSNSNSTETHAVPSLHEEQTPPKKCVCKNIRPVSLPVKTPQAWVEAVKMNDPVPQTAANAVI